MDLHSAISIYGLRTQDFSREDLDRGFKKLVKKYHPDKNQKFADWCHIRMTEINEAYELLMEFLESRPAEETVSTGNEKYHESSARQADSGRKKDNPIFRKAVTLYFEGVHTYYDYELTKRSLRQEGVWRYHYRRSVKMMEKALRELAKRAEHNPEDDQWENFLTFGQLFLTDIQSFEPAIPLSLRGSKTHIAYSEASSAMEKAFSGFFSAEEGDREKHLSPLYRASHLLILLIENYPQTEWYSLALQKLNLLDSFLDLQDLIRAGIVTF